MQVKITKYLHKFVGIHIFFDKAPCHRRLLQILYSSKELTMQSNPISRLYPVVQKLSTLEVNCCEKSIVQFQSPFAGFTLKFFCMCSDNVASDERPSFQINLTKIRKAVKKIVQFISYSDLTHGVQARELNAQNKSTNMYFHCGTVHLHCTGIKSSDFRTA